MTSQVEQARKFEQRESFTNALYIGVQRELQRGSTQHEVTGEYIARAADAFDLPYSEQASKVLGREGFTIQVDAQEYVRAMAEGHGTSFLGNRLKEWIGSINSTVDALGK